MGWHGKYGPGAKARAGKRRRKQAEDRARDGCAPERRRKYRRMVRNGASPAVAAAACRKGPQ